ncbi:MAG: AgmX/PglI C-terminal domain-containing protein [Deltaproteobacteria bacterium]|jgi:hypothetical protein|nr:AgmX/PglI C-terminal domain-containing protein [Deltaproteobacteria bacterium]MBT6436087.1 AgmX/PglI C-terminal domain-containing protein [Deltaproteobacteria bacterium]MBT6490369.1 AgmX/PglI C-terminal domain-containing protein [Deltaproteobacteria bacterium]
MNTLKLSSVILIVTLSSGCTTEDAVFHANDCANLFMEGDFRLALEAGARALHIDPENKPAEICVGRTRRELKFQTHLLDALNAVGEKDYESALECLERVPTNCESSQAADTLRKLVDKLIPAQIKRKHKRKRLAKVRKKKQAQKKRPKKKKAKAKKPAKDKEIEQDPVLEAEEPSPAEESLTGDEEMLEESDAPKRRRAAVDEDESGESTADPRAIAKVFSKRSRDFKACLELDLKKKQSASKRIIVQVTIGPRGDVRDVWTVSRKYRNSKLAKCIERKIDAWRFPAFSGSAAVIEQPIDLSVIDQ